MQIKEEIKVDIPIKKRKKKSWFKKLWSKSKKNKDEKEERKFSDSLNEIEPDMSLTQMADFLSGQDKTLLLSLEEVQDLQKVFVETLSKLEHEVTKPPK